MGAMTELERIQAARLARERKCPCRLTEVELIEAHGIRVERFDRAISEGSRMPLPLERDLENENGPEGERTSGPEQRPSEPVRAT